MIEEIVKLRRKGLSFRKIAVELNSTVGKVQYQWKKYMKMKSAASGQDTGSRIQHKKDGKPLSIARKFEHVHRDDHLCIWLVSPNKLYSFWRLSEEQKMLISNYYQRSFSDFQLVLRLYDVTCILFNGSNAHDVFEIYLPQDNKCWFFEGLKPNRCYCAELGIKLSDQKFLPILRSNTVHAPRSGVEQAGELAKELEWFQNRRKSAPKWVEHVSTYSFYETKEALED
ncbi:DUF4912 domain-containing protein [Bacillus methanolicus]|uniref:DUF4912 domain-containing protein n=1 Tax=Bacillus methanolicus (strain MGA3 / ATCC 53907) TaxID=796606 RepID=I3EAH7_BACMM|nr:DUF4912 domain-containing protein [Bacillus methanolicus]AIE60738.1 hypothetical protein BMMGA3_11715 [Bacillus methanolicus MGA3]EIJ83498.1 hypothetical protein MGA3_09770 [Bacillus methanolicus MGA3]